MALARGGQTLLTAEARDELGNTAHKVDSHGHWMVKGVADPIELFEVGAPDARFVAAARRREGAPRRPGRRLVAAGQARSRTTCRTRSTSFIGRERELAEVKALLARSRLLTLLGMGGLGKTRLSLQAAAEQIHEFPDGVWFLDLAPISDPALIVSETAQVLGVREEPDRPLLQTLCAHLKTRAHC